MMCASQDVARCVGLISQQVGAALNKRSAEQWRCFN